MNVFLEYRMLRMSISYHSMLKNYVVRFTTIMLPAGLKLSLKMLGRNLLSVVSFTFFDRKKLYLFIY